MLERDLDVARTALLKAARHNFAQLWIFGASGLAERLKILFPHRLQSKWCVRRRGIVACASVSGICFSTSKESQPRMTPSVSSDPPAGARSIVKAVRDHICASTWRSYARSLLGTLDCARNCSSDECRSGHLCRTFAAVEPEREDRQSQFCLHRERRNDSTHARGTRAHRTVRREHTRSCVVGASSQHSRAR